MAYVDSSGQRHISLSEASHGYAAQTTASRDAAGTIVGDSTGSRYSRQQEAEKEQVLQSTQQVQQTQQAGFLTPSLNNQFQAEKAAIVTEQAQRQQQAQQQNLGLVSRIKTAFTQGYAAGEGKSYSLEGLTQPKTQVEDMTTYSFYEKANSLSQKVDSVQNSVLSGIPEGKVKGFVTGVTNLAEYSVASIGAFPLGVESMIRNTESSPETISLGYGALAGVMVQKAKTNPAEFAGEIVGSIALAKVGGKLETNVKQRLPQHIPSAGLKNLALDERASLAPQRLVYKEQSFKSSELPKLNKETESYVVVGDKIMPESMTKINRVTIGDDVVLTPEMEQVLFKKTTDTYHGEPISTPGLNRDIFSPELTGTNYVLTPEMKQVFLGKAPKPQAESLSESRFVISSVKAADDVTLTPEMEQVLFKKNKINKITIAEEVKVPKIKSTITGFELGKISTSQGVIIPSFALTLPLMQGITFQESQKQKEISIPVLGVPSIASSSQATIPQTDLMQSSMPKPNINPNINPNPNIDPGIDPIPNINPNIDPIPNIDPGIDPIPNINPNIGPIPNITPTIDPLLVFIPPVYNPKIITPIGGDFNFLNGQTGNTPKRRKTKNKTLKNVYGDPFKIKLKL